MMSRPKLNLRDFFWLVALVALALGWYCDRRALWRQTQQQGEDLRRAHVQWIDAEFKLAFERRGGGLGEVNWHSDTGERARPVFEPLGNADSK
jgi:hypothetical protein